MDMWKKYEKHSKIIDSYYDKINKENHIQILNELYDFIKGITSNYYKNREILRQYDFLKTELLLCEKKENSIKILDVPVRLNDLDKDNIIEYIVLKTRKFLLKTKLLGDNNQVKLEELNLSNDCHKAAHFIEYLCDKYNVESYLLPIYPRYSKESMLYNGNGYHFANIIKYNNKYYLVDTTYSQFFYTVRNNLNRLGILNTGGCNPGVFILMHKMGNRIAAELITNGYIELNEEIFKSYLDAFTISFRNGLYYEQTNDYSFTAEYTIDDYMKFINGEDSQIEREGRLYLGYQMVPLNDYIRQSHKNFT